MRQAIHASAIVVGERGLLIRGASGAGKSLLALAIIARVTAEGRFAALVADDRVWLEACGDRLLAQGAPELAGICERRCQGLVEAAHEPVAVLRLVVDIADRNTVSPRIPADADRYADFGALRLPRTVVDLAPGVDEGARACLAALNVLKGAKWQKNDLNNQVFA